MNSSAISCSYGALSYSLLIIIPVHEVLDFTIHILEVTLPVTSEKAKVTALFQNDIVVCFRNISVNIKFSA